MFTSVSVLFAAILVFAFFKWHQERKARLRLEEALRAGEAQWSTQEASLLTDEFVSILSHELRTQLTPILGAAYMLRTERHDPGILQRCLDLIERNAKAQSKIIEDLLEVSRILNGKLRLNTENVELETVVQAAVETIRPASEAKNIQIQLDLRRLSGVVFGDGVRLQQVVGNLLSNSVKFTPRGGAIAVELDEIESASLRILFLTSSTASGKLTFPAPTHKAGWASDCPLSDIWSNRTAAQSAPAVWGAIKAPQLR